MSHLLMWLAAVLGAMLGTLFEALIGVWTVPLLVVFVVFLMYKRAKQK